MSDYFDDVTQLLREEHMAREHARNGEISKTTIDYVSLIVVFLVALAVWLVWR